MEFKLIFYLYQILCAAVFFEVLFTMKKNSFLKSCFLTMIASLFFMNYLSSAVEVSRLQFVLVKSMRVIYTGTTMLAIIRLVTPKIPNWIISFTTLSVFFLIGIRIFYFYDVNIEDQAGISNQVFSVGKELYHPSSALLYTVLSLATIAGGLTYYYYRRFFLKMNKEDHCYVQLSRWIISIVVPFFLLVIFGILGIMNVFHRSVSPLLFSFFSLTIICSILFRPKFLNKPQQLVVEPVP